MMMVMVVVVVMVSSAILPCISAGISLHCAYAAASGVIFRFVRRSSKSQVTSAVNLLLHALSN